MNKTTTMKHKWLAFALFALSFQPLTHAANLVKNGDFSVAANGVPADWKLMKNVQTVAIDTTEITGDSKQSLRVDIGKQGEGLGQIVQQISATPYKKYLLKFDMKSSAAGTGLGSVKLQVGKSELSRLATRKSTTGWQSYSVEMDSGEANVILVLLRYEQKPASVGQKVWFANVSLEQTGDGAAPATTAAPAAPAPATPAAP
ncbi:MAG: DUF642 domain-containing protein [Candidatus Methylacidiphilales bacterium]